MQNLFLVLILSFPFIANGQVTDHEGRTYATIKIGNQTWMAENLNVSTFRNGDTIPAAYDGEEWMLGEAFMMPAYVDLNFDEANGQFLGKLYNYLAISDERGIAPEGWRIPTDEDWNQLAEALGGSAAATIKLKSAQGWSSENGTNESGFQGYPIGMINDVGEFEGFGEIAFFWSSTLEENLVINRNLGENKYPFEKALSYPFNGLSVRLIKID
ncbi:fibrobacter succinogenes major paralogous domain-containing protein [Algoriphagus sanaruensis]|uniref:Fibrobacter succinogenes major paralogous domain-containing protein n=1 Tax=Algoriphagus sanaruensis TaxID=1727163 RepID=A0A142ELI5_9BACT|nr:fibrobacter succinogenes major paralogous domain-containing protein [Algoriphagus sanaruensis]AMQ55990.1 hypothetical protein AO498_06165 [Algoriphagus sanaruensis]